MKTKPHYISFIWVIGFFIFSCTNDSNQEEILNDLDSLNQEVIDSTDIDISTFVQAVDTIKKVYDNPEIQEAHVAIVKKYGEQWDFCKCIIKSDSVNTALMEASDEEFDGVMERSDFIDNKCKGLLIQPNSTPEDRYKHENKVKKCLLAVKK